MLLSEDKRFYEHSGVDWRAVSAAAWGNLWNTRTRGASTITMQLAGLLDDELRRGGGGRSARAEAAADGRRHAAGAPLAQGPDPRGLPQPVPFRGEIVGIDALSRTLFAKAPHGLDAREAALAAALVRAPNARPARGRAARLRSPARDGARRPKADCAALDMFTSARAAAAAPSTPAKASRRIWRGMRLREHAGRGSDSIRTTLRAPLQRFALRHPATPPARAARPQRGRRRRRGARQRQRRGAGLGRLVGRAEPRGRGRRRAGAAPARLDAQALALRAGDRRAPAHRGLAAGRLVGADRHRRRPVHPAELRPPVQGPGVGAHRARGLAQRARRAHAGDGVARRLCAPAARGRAAAGAGRRFLRLQPGPGQRRGLAAGPDQRVPHAGQRRALRRDALPARTGGADIPRRAPPSIRAPPSSSATSWRTRTHARAPSAPTACSPRASGAR